MKQGIHEHRRFLILVLPGLAVLLCIQSLSAQPLVFRKSGPVFGNPGNTVTYTINYLNNSGSAITNVVIRDTLPTQFTYTTQSFAGGVTFSGLAGNVLTWTAPVLAKGLGGSITISGKFGLKGSVGYPSYDPSGYYVATGCTSNPNNIINHSSMSSTETGVVYSSLISNVTQCCGSSITPPSQSGSIKKFTGSIILYSYTLKNTGNINDEFNLSSTFTGDPMTTTFLDMGNNPVTSSPWIVPGGTWHFQLRQVVGSGSPNVTNVTTIIATSVVCNSSSTANAITFEYNGSNPPPPNSNDLIISKFATPSGAVVPGTITYTVNVLNNVSSGNKTANSVFVTDELPANTIVVAGSATPPASVIGHTVTWDAGDIAPNGIFTGTIQVTTSCTSVPSVINQAFVTSTPPDADTTNNDVTLTTPVLDNVPPVARCRTAILMLDATGNATLAASLVDNGSSDNCGTITLSVSPNTFTCSNAGNNTVTLTVTDASGNTASCSTSINVISTTSPNITAQPVNTPACIGSNVVFSLTATGTGLSYQWQVNTGSGFANLTNGAPYSGVTTSTLNITGTTTTMNGYQYRCVVSGTCPAGSNATSNSATLTIIPRPVTSPIYHR